MIFFSNSFGEWDEFNMAGINRMLFGIPDSYVGANPAVGEYLFDLSHISPDGFFVISLGEFMEKFLDSIQFQQHDRESQKTITKELCNIFRKLNRRQTEINIDFATNFRYGLGVDLYPFIGDC